MNWFLAIIAWLVSISVAYYWSSKGFPFTTAVVATIIALVGFFWQIYTYFKKGQYDKSAFRLTSALDAFEEARKLLQDKNNDRVKWVTAARALQRGVRISSGITEEVHKDVLEFQRDRYRLIFGDILGYYNHEINGGFFYGAPPEIIDIGEAARYSTRREEDRPQLRALSENTLKIVWDFAQFPDGYDDPVSDVNGFSEQDTSDTFNPINYPALFEYLDHKKNFVSVNGELHPRSNPIDENHA